MKNKKNTFKKDKDFLTQIPDWEKGYKDSEEQIIKFEKEKWKTEKAVFTEHDIKIFGYAVMEDWETPYMKELADIAASKGGTVLELGYGMGISANFIQQHNIEKHIIIEVNKDIVKKAKIFAKKAPHKTEILYGLWEDMIKKIPDNSLSGILFDTYPLTEKELYQNHFNFFPFAYKKLKKGGVFTYYSDEIKNYSKVHLKKLQEAGFKKENIKRKISKVNPPKDCEYWKAKTILSPIITK
ncbi:class I SAM-dependent methyltransferase [Candidatus Nomurabacteria bacterium]|nr:class I SAM-dependent methyltransferase [Candidatus Nomurabacteria bacterium]